MTDPMTSVEIQRCLHDNFHRRSFLNIYNAYIYAWESDFITISKSGIAIEFEIKISRSDFRADFKKTDKHRWLSEHKKQWFVMRWPHNPKFRGTWQSQYSSLRYVRRVEALPNRFYYIAPEGVIRLDEVPAYAGLVEICGSTIYYCKKAPPLHGDPFESWKDIAQKFYYRNIQLREK